MSERVHTFDLIVVGGGMVGAAFALAGAGKGLRLALVEAQAPRRSWPAGEIDLRVSALSRASQRILERLDVWERILELGASPYRRMRVWDAAGGTGIGFDAQELGEPDLGWIVENRVIQLALWEALEDCLDVTLAYPAAIQTLDSDASGARLTLADGRELEAGLLVGADGRDSQVRALAGIATDRLDYDQQAIVTHVRPERWHEETAWQRFLPTGPLALLPLADGRCSVVWSATLDRAAELMALDDTDFGAALTEASDACLGRLAPAGARAAVSLRREHARQYVRSGLALIGDAAHAVHPLAGQGVNLGFLDAAALAEALEQGRALGRSIGGLWTLRRYERARRGDNALTIEAMDALKRLFGSQAPTLVLARRLGLAATDRLAPVKRRLMARALGLTADLPLLARPVTH